MNTNHKVAAMFGEILFAFFMFSSAVGNPVRVRSPQSTTPPYPVSISTGPASAEPTAGTASVYHTSHGLGTDPTTSMTIHSTIHRTVTLSSDGCIINARNADLIFWDTTTYDTTLVQHGVGTDAIKDTFAVDLKTLSSFGAAATKITTVNPPKVSALTTTTQTTRETFSGFTDTDSIVYYSTLHSFPSDRTQAYSATTTRFLTRTQAPSTATFTFTSFPSVTTEQLAGASAILRPDVVSKNVTNVYTIHSPSPYAYFSVFEVERAAPKRGGSSDGSALAISTSTFTAPVPFLSPLDFDGSPGFAGLRNSTGPLSPDVIGLLTNYEGVDLDLSDCVAGTVQGDVTVYIVYNVVEIAVSPAHAEISESDLGGDLPTPTPTEAPSQKPSPHIEPLPKSSSQPVPKPQPTKDSPHGSQIPKGKNPPAKENPEPVDTPFHRVQSVSTHGPTSSQGLTIENGIGSKPFHPSKPIPTLGIPSDDNVPTPILPHPSPTNDISKPTDHPTLPGERLTTVPVDRVSQHASPPPPTTLNVGNVQVTVLSNNIIFNAQTIRPSPGSAPTTLAAGSDSIIINPSQIIGGDTTIAFPTFPAILSNPPIITIGASAITANAHNEFVISGQTLTPGGPELAVGGTTLSLAPDASAIAIGSNSVNLINPSPPRPSITLGSSVIVANSAGQFVVSGQTLTPGGPAISVAGSTMSLAPSASEIVIGSSTISLAKPSPALPPLPFITFGSSTITANSHTDFVIGSQTVSPGKPAITVSGTTVSLAPSASIIFINNTPRPLVPEASFSLPVIILPTSSINLGSNSELAIGSQTLIPGHSAITVSGTPVSLAPGASDVVVGTSTEPLASFIMQGFGPPTPKPSTPGNVTTFTGGAERLGRWGWIWSLGLWVLGYVVMGWV